MSSPARVSDQAVVAALRSACAAGTVPPAAAWTLLVCLVARLIALSDSYQSHATGVEHVALRLAHAGVFDCCANMIRSLAPVDSPPSNGQVLPRRWRACCALLLIPTVCDTLVTLAPRLAQTCYQSEVVTLATALLWDMTPRAEVNLDLLLLACRALVHLVLSGAASDDNVQAACAVCCGPLLRRGLALRPVNAEAVGQVCLYISLLLGFARRSGIADVTQRDRFSTVFALGMAVGASIRGVRQPVMESIPLSRALQASRSYISDITPTWQLVVADAAFVDGVVVAALVVPHPGWHAAAVCAIRCALILALAPWLVAWQACGRVAAWARSVGTNCGPSCGR
jgi:hypothetical protein